MASMKKLRIINPEPEPVKPEPEPVDKCASCDCEVGEDDEKYWCSGHEEYICEECHGTTDKCHHRECDCCGDPDEESDDSEDEPEPEPEPEPVKPKQEYNCLIAQYEPRFQYFKIPDEWDKKDIMVMWGELFYKGERQDVPNEIMEGDEKRPVEISIEAVEDMPYFNDE